MSLSEKVSEFLFKEEDFTKIRKLPSNGVTESYLAESNSDHRKVVLKYFRLISDEACHTNGTPKQSFYDFLYDKTTSLNHPCLCPIEGYTVPNEKRIPIIVSTYCENGALTNDSMNRLNQSKKWVVAIGLASALKYLHKENVFGLNLKPWNILLDKNDYPHITDYLFESYTKTDIPPTMNIGTILYKAPEYITKSHPVSEKSDIYTLGLIFFHLFSGTSAFNNKENHITQFFKFAHGYRPEIPDSISPLIADIIKQCWDPNPDLRPAASTVMDLLVSNIQKIVDALDEKIIVPFLRMILDFDYGTALAAFGDARGKTNAAKALYNSTTAPTTRKKALADLKVCAEAGDREAKHFYKKVTGESIQGDDDGIEDEKDIQLKHEKKSVPQNLLPKIKNKEIVEAANKGDRERIRQLLSESVDVNSKDDDGDTALSVAARKGDLPLVQMLLTVSGIDINTQSEKGYTPLHEACRFGKEEIVTALLLIKGLDLSIKDNMGYSAVDWATTEDMKKQLIKAGAVPSRKRSVKKKSSSAHKPN